MMGRKMAQGALFYGLRLDDQVPAEHLLRRIDGLFDFGFVREALAESYSTSGRPSIDPELMLRMLLVGYPPVPGHNQPFATPIPSRPFFNGFERL